MSEHRGWVLRDDSRGDLITTCLECGHQNDASAVDCAECGRSLAGAPQRAAAKAKAGDELEAMLDRLDLPDEQVATSPTEVAVSGEELFRLLIGSTATAGTIGAMDLAALTREVAYRRTWIVAPGEIDPGLADERIARAILDYARVDREEGVSPVQEAGAAASRPDPRAIQIARIVVVVVGFVSMFAPWGRDAGTIATGWSSILIMILLSAGLMIPVYLALALYGLCAFESDPRNWLWWLPHGSSLFVTEETLRGVKHGTAFWAARAGLMLGLVVAPYVILGTNIPEWPLEITWGAWLFLLAVVLANIVEGSSLIWRGREAPSRPLWVAGAVWLCLSAVCPLLPPALTASRAGRAQEKVDVVAQYGAGERDFRRAKLKYAQLDGANLREIRLEAADLSGAKMGGVNLNGASLRNATLTAAYLEGADLAGAVMSGADLRHANLIEADLTAASLDGSWLGNADLSGADLRGADLTKAEMLRADLSGADLRGTILDGAILTRASLKRAQLDSVTQIDPKWRLVWELVTRGGAGRDLSGADLSAADLDEANLHGADLTGANLGAAGLIGADLSGASLRGADLQGADLNRADLRGADLRGADLLRADLRKADLRGVDLREADLSRARLSWADLGGADLSAANVSAQQLSDVRTLEGAIMPDGTVHE